MPALEKTIPEPREEPTAAGVAAPATARVHRRHARLSPGGAPAAQRPDLGWQGRAAMRPCGKLAPILRCGASARTAFARVRAAPACARSRSNRAGRPRSRRHRRHAAALAAALRVVVDTRGILLARARRGVGTAAAETPRSPAGGAAKGKMFVLLSL